MIWFVELILPLALFLFLGSIIVVSTWLNNRKDKEKIKENWFWKYCHPSIYNFFVVLYLWFVILCEESIDWRKKNKNDRS